MTQITLTLNNYLLNPISELFNSFMSSRFMKAWEEAAVKRAEHYLARNTYRELQRLSDAELHDIGIHRGDIWDISVNGSSGRYRD